MATGTASGFVLTRNECIEQAYRKIHALRFGGSLSLEQIEQAVIALNMIIREEDLHGTDQAKNLWALNEKYLILNADTFSYNASIISVLAPDILDLVQVFYRNASGDDSEVEILDAQQFGTISDRNAKGDVLKVYLKKNRELSKQTLFVWPAPDSVATTSAVIGSDGYSYQCIMLNTSSASDQPIIGSAWELYWQKGGSATSDWATGTSYTNGELLRYIYKRPLYEFTSPTDNPDLPAGWSRYLVFRLATDLAPEYGIGLEERVWLERQWRDARQEIFPSTRSGTTEIHNKGLYY